jgi:hypothetical protein
MKFKKILFFILFIFLTKEIFASCCESSPCNSLNSCESSSCNTPCSISKNFWMPRAFVSYQEHDLYQMQHTHAYKSERKLNFSFITEYMQNFGQKCNSCKNLGSLPFWSGTNSLTVGRNDGRAQLDAYQLDMGNVAVDENGIAGTITLNPRVQHVGTDMSIYWVQHAEKHGFYFRMHAPLVALSITPNLSMNPVIDSSKELGFTQTSTGGSTYDYQFIDYSVPERRPANIVNAFYGGEANKNVLAGSITKAIQFDFGRVSSGKQTAIRLGDITATFGYNVFANEKGFAGIGFKFSCPTGNVPTAIYMLEPIVGRAGLWGVGAEVCASYQVWQDSLEDRRLTFSLEGEVLHLFSGRTPNMRSFDLKQNGPGSKYLLLQHYVAAYASSSPDVTVSQGGAVNPNYEIFFPLKIRPAINVTTLPVISKFSAEGSVAMMLDFVSHNWNTSLGGEFWGRANEKLCIDKRNSVALSLSNLNHFAVVGRQVSTYHVPGNTTTPNGTNVYAYFCEPLARINKSQDPVKLAGVLPGLTAPTELPEGIADGRLVENRIPENYKEALDIEGAAASRALTGKIFGQVGYTFKDHCYIPTIALIGGAEFTGKTNSAIQLWSIGLQAALNF